MIRLTILIPALLFGALLAQQEEGGQDQTTRRLQKIREYITEAGTGFTDEDYEWAGKRITEAQVLLARAMREGSEDYREQFETEHRRIAKAHELLTAQGIDLSDLEPIPEQLGAGPEESETPMEGGEDSGTEESPAGSGNGNDNRQPVSFKDQVRPLLVQYCERCHVRGSRGDFSLRSYEVLMSGKEDGTPVIVAGSPDESILFQQVESGEMPPREDIQLAADEVSLIKRWIEQGATFDGEDPAADINKKTFRDADRPNRQDPDRPRSGG
ncbi:MAG: c-type cytochrome domain-containing protein [Pirellulaceae bacterium]